MMAIGVLAVTFVMKNFGGGFNARHDAVVYIDSIKLNVEVADTAEKQIEGLSNRPNLLSDNGMLFVLNQPMIPKFWMKDMMFPIDIIWIDENMNVADVSTLLSPSTYPKTFSPSVPVKYVLEVNAGLSADAGIKAGDNVKIEGLGGKK